MFILYAASAQSAPLLMESNPGLKAEVTRPFSEVTWAGDQPNLSEEESRFYALLEVPYRTGEFYTQATSNSARDIFDKIITFGNEARTKCFAFYNRDIPQIRNMADAFALGIELSQREKRSYISDGLTPAEFPKNKQFIIIPVVEGDLVKGHATTTLSIIDAHRVLTTLHINSWLKPDYVEKCKMRFTVPAIRDHLDAPDIPFISTVLPLQQDEDDENCLFYAYNFSLALCQMLEIPEHSQTILNFARQPSHEQLQSYVVDNIRRFLPQYYDGDLNPHSPEAIKGYHLEMRWNIGKEFIEDFLKKQGML